ncbi:type 4a pilus biogenesis protein PilO [Psychrobacter sp. APC 3426]|uniref:type 4a pilus biogenesis protein PilO n=1 Tax=Psychrobacter sp. APC 3426 TaxID=3035177 RepID=UPI0025B533DB|nr:type 4a pilus biogenesis protein PilO [Psychrobacter sp. APC 3426]MDN3398133.1 type 4a pilus biogenesis protein PilO [Psychrobacter sp. APC 3426]
MKLSRKKSLIKTKKTDLKQKKQFDLQEFRRSFESLDSDNYGSWPMPVKVTVIGLIVTLIAALAWALPISSKIDEIKAAESQQQTLLESYREKESRARHLEAYQAQVIQMETEFNTLLDQLPKDTRVSELVEGINMTGVGSNIRFQDISVEAEIENEFFIEQPIRIAALGEYHQFGSFISGLAALPRIITMHDFEVSNPKPSLDVLPELNLVLRTKTYRSKEAASDETDATAGGEQ